jgi:hypothetical protein
MNQRFLRMLTYSQRAMHRGMRGILTRGPCCPGRALLDQEVEFHVPATA